ncbi:MAG: NADH-quinone oxidoreductase subunit C [Candidatus Omnitrophica bacterium]|nr:NADH-quinone oxidoreductase subunit C [Candidatus Omnitrophota bacterium]
MSNEEDIKQKLIEKFNYMDNAVTIKRERRIFADVAIGHFTEVFDYLVRQAGFISLCAITGMDEGNNTFAVIYHISNFGGAVFSLRTRIPRENPTVKTITGYFASADIYERELMDLLGIKVDGLNEGRRYPLPDNWPQGQYPLRKEWKREAKNA